MKKTILVTGSSGFIGFHLCIKLLAKNYNVIGIDNHNNYYSVKLKQDRLKEIRKFKTKFKKNFFSAITKGIRNGSVGNGKKIDSMKDIK